jgi:membrane protease YdiL (CAAX protease family)
VLSGLLGFAVVGYQEELLSRGYHLQNIRDGMGLGWGLFLSSAIFALMHLGNPNVTWYTTLPGLLAAGYFLAFGWLRTRQLWLPIGLHIGWNFFEGTVFGFPVSGIDLLGLIRQTPTGPLSFTGGPFGPEAGLVLVPAMAVGVALVWLYTRGRTA